MTMGKITLFGNSNEAIMNYLFELLRDNFKEYARYEKDFNENISQLRPYLTDETEDYTDDLIALGKLKVVTAIKHEVVLGLKANFNYFKNPAENDFLKTHQHFYLHKDQIRSIHQRNYADEKTKDIIDKLDGKGYCLYLKIQDYFTYIENTGMILAHYLGYLIGNNLIVYFVPDYVSDASHTDRYTQYIEKHLGVKITI